MLRTIFNARINGRRPRAVSNPRRSLMETSSRRFIVGAALGVGLVSLLATELLHYWLVPDIGRNQERLLAEGLSALIVSGLVAKLASVSRERQRQTIARMQVIAEMNHHIRNALAPISLSVDAIENQQLISAISEGVDRIDWALREILPRELPLREEQRDSLGYFPARTQRGGRQ
jgi:signal transduction histidine kinase